MTTFYTSDLHIGHPRVAIEHRGFPTTDDHDETLAEVWRARVKPDDVVYVLGDVAVGGIPRALEVLDKLPGRKRLVAGNHDPVHPMHRRTFARMMPRFLEVFETVTPFERRRPHKAGRHGHSKRRDRWSFTIVPPLPLEGSPERHRSSARAATGRS